MRLVVAVIVAAAAASLAAAGAAARGGIGPSQPRIIPRTRLLGFSNPSPSSSSEPPPAIPLIDRVPTFRLYKDGACLGQLRGNGEVSECRQRLHEAITSLLPSSSTTTTTTTPVAPILELESPAALEALLAQQQQQQQQAPSASSSSSEMEKKKPAFQDRAALIQAIMASSSNPPAAPAAPPSPQGQAHAAGGLLLVEFYGANCKQCRLMDPMFDSLPFAYRGRPLAFARADVTRFPALVVPPPDPQAFAGLDRSAGIEERLEGCPRCGGGGFVACEACEGKGHVVRSVEGHTVADVCMACVGHKKVPCPQCGGKCYLC